MVSDGWRVDVREARDDAGVGLTVNLLPAQCMGRRGQRAGRRCSVTGPATRHASTATHLLCVCVIQYEVGEEEDGGPEGGGFGLCFESRVLPTRVWIHSNE